MHRSGIIFPFPTYEPLELPVNNIQKFYDPNIPVHLLNARLTAQYVYTTYDTHSGLIRVSSAAHYVLTHKYDKGMLL